MLNEEKKGVKIVGARALEQYTAALQQMLPKENLQPKQQPSLQTLFQKEKLLFSREIEEFYAIEEKDVEALRAVMQMLSDTQLKEFPTIESLSKTAMMSSTKLKTRFKQIYGMKLYEFYNHHRLLQAKEMLRTGNFSVKQVGVNIGFSNLSNFAKAFKKEFGVLPREILKSK